MGVYIKGMTIEQLRKMGVAGISLSEKRLVEVKEPHGDLVDADVVKHAIINYHDKEDRIRVMINAILAGVPTVIEAEDGQC